MYFRADIKSERQLGGSEVPFSHIFTNCLTRHND